MCLTNSSVVSIQCTMKTMAKQSVLRLSQLAALHLTNSDHGHMQYKQASHSIGQHVFVLQIVPRRLCVAYVTPSNLSSGVEGGVASTTCIELVPWHPLHKQWFGCQCTDGTNNIERITQQRTLDLPIQWWLGFHAWAQVHLRQKDTRFNCFIWLLIL